MNTMWLRTSVLSKAVKVITGFEDPSERLRVSGLLNVNVSQHPTHFKGIYAHDCYWTFIAMGSWNMRRDSRYWNQGLVLLAWNAFPFEFRELYRPIVSECLFPIFEHNFLQQILSYTNGKCEVCKQPTPAVYISYNGLLSCGECSWKIDRAWIEFHLDNLSSNSEKEEFLIEEFGI